MTLAQDKALFDHAGKMVESIESMLASHDHARSIVIRIFPLNEELACDGEVSAINCEAEYRSMGYAVSRHQTRQGAPYIKCTIGRGAA